MKPEHDIQKSIIKMLMKQQASFGEIKHWLGARSNKLAYHLNSMHKNSLIKKTGSTYTLTETGNLIAPYIDHECPYPLTVVLVAPCKNNKVLLRQRRKEAFRGWWAIPSKKLIFAEKPNMAAIDILERAKTKPQIVKYIRTVSEINVEKAKPRYHFIFILYKADITAYEKTPGYRWFSIKALPKKTIPTDKHMIETIEKKSFEQIGMNISKKGLKFLERG